MYSSPAEASWSMYTPLTFQKLTSSSTTELILPWNIMNKLNGSNEPTKERGEKLEDLN